MNPQQLNCSHRSTRPRFFIICSKKLALRWASRWGFFCFLHGLAGWLQLLLSRALETCIFRRVQVSHAGGHRGTFISLLLLRALETCTVKHVYLSRANGHHGTWYRYPEPRVRIKKVYITIANKRSSFCSFNRLYYLDTYRRPIAGSRALLQSKIASSLSAAKAMLQAHRPADVMRLAASIADRSLMVQHGCGCCKPSSLL